MQFRRLSLGFDGIDTALPFHRNSIGVYNESMPMLLIIYAVPWETLSIKSAVPEEPMQILKVEVAVNNRITNRSVQEK